MESEKKSNGALIGSIVIIIILIIGGIYLWKASMKENAEDTTAPVNSSASGDLEADVNSVDVEYLDSEI